MDKSNSIPNFRRKCLTVDCIKLELSNYTLTARYTAGFFDGDGSIRLINACYVGIEVGQCDPRPLVALQSRFGGTILRTERTITTQRDIYKWTISCRGAEHFLTFIKDDVIVEADKVTASLAMIDAIKHCDRLGQLSIISGMASMGKQGDASKPYDRMSMEYIAGLIDAEGCLKCRIRKDKYLDAAITITQKLDPELMRCVAEHLGYGAESDGRYVLFIQDDIIDLLQKIMGHLIVKKEQALMLLKLLTATCMDLEEKGRLVQEVMAGKHTEYINDNLAAFNAEGKALCDANKDNVATAEQLQRKEELREAARARMTGPSNPNFGKERDVQHSMRIAEAMQQRCIDKGRMVSDEDMVKIRELRPTMKAYELAERFGVTRSYIHAITRDKIVPSNEVTPELLQKRHEQKALVEATKARMGAEEYVKMRKTVGKRSVSTDAIVRCLRYKVSTPYFRGYFVQASKDSEILFGVKFTEAMLKQWMSGKSRLLDVEFPIGDYTRDEYQAFLDTLST